MPSPRTEIEGGIDNASVLSCRVEADAVRGQSIETYWEVLAMPFDRAERQVDDRPFGEARTDFVWQQKFESRFGLAHL